MLIKSLIAPSVLRRSQIYSDTKNIMVGYNFHAMYVEEFIQQILHYEPTV